MSVFIYIFGDDCRFKLEQILKKKIHKMLSLLNDNLSAEI